MKRLSTCVLVLLTMAACSESSTGPTLADQDLLMQSVQGGQARVDVCHIDGKGRVRMVSVAAPALQAHLGHGDTEPATRLELMSTDGATFSASNTWVYQGEPQGPDKAFDGLYANTNPATATGWNSGQWPSATNPQWIEIDFGSPRTFSEMRGHVAIAPNGYGRWDVTFDGAPAFAWDEYLYGWQEIAKPFVTDQTAQVVRLSTTWVGGSWAAWLEIQFFETVTGC